MKTVCVIGGGAAGLMAAYAAGKNGHQVTLLEKNEKLGKKLTVTYSGDTLPCFVEWNSAVSGDYAVGLEPACFCNLCLGQSCSCLMKF